MEIIETKIHGMLKVHANRFQDHRGNLTKPFSIEQLNQIGLTFEISEIFTSTSQRNVLRGMHFSLPPYDGYKIVYCTSGCATDVVFDLRTYSPTYETCWENELSSNEPIALIIPPGVAHGFLSNQDNTTIVYMVSNRYLPKYDAGIRYDSFGYEWEYDSPIISERDLALPSFRDFINPYVNIPLGHFLRCKKKVMVTGATGFVGGRMVEMLKEIGWSVIALVRDSVNINYNTDSSGEPIRVYKYDGTIDSIAVPLGIEKPDYIFHIAAMTFHSYSSDQIDDIVASNITFGINLAEAMKLTGVDKMINTGTSWEHYKNESYNPVNLYSATKKAFRDIIISYVQSGSLRVIDLKLFDTWGESDQRNKLFSHVDEASRAGDTLSLSPGDQLLDLTHVSDVCRAFLCATEHFDNSDVDYLEFGVSRRLQLPLRAVIQKYIKHKDYDVGVDFGARKYREREVMRPWTPCQVLNNWASSMDFLDD